MIDRAGDLGCALARDGLEFSPGKIYLAVPDHHLILQDGRMPHSEEGMRGRIGEIGKHLQVVQNLLATIRK